MLNLKKKSFNLEYKYLNLRMDHFNIKKEFKIKDQMLTIMSKKYTEKNKKIINDKQLLKKKCLMHWLILVN